MSIILYIYLRKDANWQWDADDDVDLLKDRKIMDLPQLPSSRTARVYIDGYLYVLISDHFRFNVGITRGLTWGSLRV